MFLISKWKGNKLGIKQLEKTTQPFGVAANHNIDKY